MVTGQIRIGARVLGAHIDAVGWGECLERILGWAARGESRYVCLCNVHSVVTAWRIRGFNNVVNGADLAAPDGAPIAWYLRARGFYSQQRISGPELMWKCCARAAGEGLPVFLYGGREEALRRLSARLVREFPRIRIAGCFAPPFRALTSAEDAQVAEAINESGARIVLVALGCPRQEAWMAAQRGRIRAVMVGVGAAFDFHAGAIHRAPPWMQEAGLEWLHRLAAEPRRLWRRYFVTNSLFLANLAVETVGGREADVTVPQPAKSQPKPEGVPPIVNIRQAEVEMKIQPVVLCGGSGTRLWPMSREQHPKQLLALNGGLTLLQETVRRMDGLEARLTRPAEPVVICNEDHRFLVADQMRAIGAKPRSIILEPAGKGTAPALTLAALHTLADEDPVLIVMPSDHIITGHAEFHEAIRRGTALALAGYVVTFGVPPATAETGYGYIRTGEALPGGRSPAAFAIGAFVEKPDAETAHSYLLRGAHLWNSGMFMVRASCWLDAIGRCRPEILAACELAHGQSVRDGEFYRVDAGAFEKCPADSIDYAVMEKITARREAQAAPRAAVVRLDAGWSDVGAWDALWKAGRQDGDGNVIRGDVCAVDAHRSLLISQHRLLACVGLDDVVVVETPDAVMVARRDRAQDVKGVVSRLKSEGRAECLAHRKVHRPWGSYDGIDRGERFQVKRIIVNPGAALSLQVHYHRAEHWVVVRGTARVTRGDQTFLLSENESTYIPVGVKHRLENPGKMPLEIIEVQSGAYLGEDDIVRFDDAYGRTPLTEAAAIIRNLAPPAPPRAGPGGAAPSAAGTAPKDRA